MVDSMTIMRRKDREIIERVVLEEILREHDVGRLATCVDNKPYIVPVNYAYSNGKIFFHSYKDGKKIQNIRLNPFVCFEVDSGDILEAENPCKISYRYKSVIVMGKARIIKKPEQKLDRFRLIIDKYSPGKGKKLDLEALKKVRDLLVVEIDIAEMTGKRNPG
jgi:nitroimidazol reductase NimA-like FMN-containing flavoprotein (pyridoxamine 5'-phosphate oxidase superfamily)